MTTSKNQSALPSQALVDEDDPNTWDCIIDHEDDIDWDNIIATTEEDDKAGRYLFNSADYATPEESMIALRELIHSICEKAEKRVAARTASHAAGSKRY